MMKNENTQMPLLKKFLVTAAIGSLVGAVVSTWLGPKTIAWYFETPVSIGINCRPATEWAMSKLIFVQKIGLAAGAILFVVLSYFVQLLLNRRLDEVKK